MAQDTALQVIELQQLPIIVERLHSVKADIERRTAEATSLICTEETYKSVKDARAQLTKEFKEYEAQRTAIKSKILEPYNAFEQVYRECVTAPFQQADAELKQKIADVTSGIVAQKTEALMDYYGELVEAADIDWLDPTTVLHSISAEKAIWHPCPPHRLAFTTSPLSRAAVTTGTSTMPQRAVGRSLSAWQAGATIRNGTRRRRSCIRAMW